MILTSHLIIPVFAFGTEQAYPWPIPPPWHSDGARIDADWWTEAMSIPWFFNHPANPRDILLYGLVPTEATGAKQRWEGTLHDLPYARTCTFWITDLRAREDIPTGEVQSRISVLSCPPRWYCKRTRKASKKIIPGGGERHRYSASCAAPGTYKPRVAMIAAHARGCLDSRVSQSTAEMYAKVARPSIARWRSSESANGGKRIMTREDGEAYNAAIRASELPEHVWSPEESFHLSLSDKVRSEVMRHEFREPMIMAANIENHEYRACLYHEEKAPLTLSLFPIEAMSSELQLQIEYR